MRKILKFLKPHMAAVLSIVAVLIVQAYCDLSLPSYTSDIVNIGIQQGGVDTHIPEMIAEEDMENLLLFVPKKEQDVVRKAYEEDDTTYEKAAYVLKDGLIKEEDKVKELEEILGKPMLLVSGIESGEHAGEMQMLQKMPEEQRLAVVDEMSKKIEDMPGMMMEQASTLYVRSAYKNLDIDADKMQSEYILFTGLKMLALAALGMMASVLVGLFASKVAASVGRDLRSSVFRKVVGFSNGEFDKFSTASLITRSTNDIQQIQMVIVMMLRMVLYAPIIGIGGIFKALNTNVSMSWIIGLGVVMISLLVLTLFLVAMPKFKVLQKLVDKLNLVTREILTGLMVIRAFSTEKHEEKRFDQANRDLTKTTLFVNRAMTIMMPTMMLIMNGISVLIIWVGANGINDGQMQVGDMMAFIQYTMQIIMAFLMICMISIMLPRAAVSADRVDEILMSSTLIQDPKNPKKLTKDGKGTVEFDHVSFRYPGAKEDVLHDISFVAEPGKTTAFIGSTGSGKSTLVNLIPRFYDVTEGAIRIEGVDIREISQHDLREKLGYVPQKGVLFSGTIASNILYGNRDGSEADMKDAASIAQAQDFIEAKQDTYDSPIAQGGTNVSGGQKQRLSIARAIAKNPDVFIFVDSF